MENGSNSPTNPTNLTNLVNPANPVNPTKIYVVTSGYYSDRRIEFCTLNYELARAFVDKRNPYLSSWDSYSIHEYEDTITKEKTIPVFRYEPVSDEVHITDSSKERIEEIETCKDGADYCDIDCKNCPQMIKSYHVYVKAPDADLARRIAQDRLAQYKAKQAGIC